MKLYNQFFKTYPIEKFPKDKGNNEIKIYFIFVTKGFDLTPSEQIQEHPNIC